VTRIPSRIVPSALGVAVLLTVGCHADPAPVVQIGHYLRSPESVLGLKRVVFVVLQNRQGTPRIAHGTTEAVARAIQRRGLFHIDVVAETDPICRDVPLYTRGAYSMKQLAEIRSALECDAVLFGSITQFQPYPRMQIGLYLRLLDLRQGKLVWGIDHTWDTTDRQTEDRIRRFHGEYMRDGYGPAEHRITLMSPRMFQEFVAHEAVGTLPSRTPTPEGDKRGTAESRRRIWNPVREIAKIVGKRSS